MTAARDHLRRILAWAARKLVRKYLAGQQAHGGRLADKPGMLRNLTDEVLDLVVYTQTLEEQLRALLSDLEPDRRSDGPPISIAEIRGRLRRIVIARESD